MFKLTEECLLSLGTSIFMSAAVFFAVGLQGNWLLFWTAFYLTTCTGIGLLTGLIIAASSPGCYGLYQSSNCSVSLCGGGNMCNSGCC